MGGFLDETYASAPTVLDVLPSSSPIDDTSSSGLFDTTPPSNYKARDHEFDRSVLSQICHKGADQLISIILFK
jgi:hypothetical protein